MRTQAQCMIERDRWLQAPGVDEETKAALRSVSQEELSDSFYRDLAFGTGGLRGTLGAGTNRMNVYTVRRATQGLCDHLRGTDLPQRVAIAYDSRIGSDLFAREAAAVLAANGIQALLYPRLEPTPALSFAVRDAQCGAGICITASHNPAQYNGYKVYGPDGCQITLEMAEGIERCINAVDLLAGARTGDFDAALSQGGIRYLGEDVLDRYLASVLSLSVCDVRDVPLRVVYTPLNGAGRECVTRILAASGIDAVHIVPEQEQPNGHFPTCPYPNPEIPEALTLGLRDCAKFTPDLLLATDPDCDRVGIAVPDGGEYVLLTGNEVGILLLDYVCRVRMENGTLPANPVAVTTIVSSAMADPVAQAYGVSLRRTLTGFKFIGEQIGLLEQAGEAHRFVFGFEESCGYLSGTQVRDKDAVNAAMLICEMARWYKKQGKTLADALGTLYATYGYYHNALYSYDFAGASGMTAMAQIMNDLRNAPPTEIGGLPVLAITDYLGGGTDLPVSDVLTFTLAGDAKLIMRPSGTEPKLKAYVFTRGNTKAQAEKMDAGIAKHLQQITQP